MTKLIPLFGVFSLLISCVAVMHAEENAVESTESNEAKLKEAKSNASVPNSTELKLSDTEITKLIKQLDSDSFALREAAVKDLTKAGRAAVPKVAEATQGESLEASARAFDVLNKWIFGEDQLVKVAAIVALEKLAGGDEKSKAVRRSKALLAKSNSPRSATVQLSSTTVHVFGGGGHVPPPVVRAGEARVQIARAELLAMAKVAAGVRGRSVRISVANGKKTMRATEGDNLVVDIVEDKEDGIQIKVTEKDKDGTEKISEYAAKSLEELKEKQPEGHKVYEKYAGALNGLKIKLGEPKDPVDFKD